MREDRLSFQCKSLTKQIERYLFSSVDKKRIHEIMPCPTISQMRIIGYIINSDKDVYQRDLEKVLNLRRATVSGVLQTMEKNNLIKRVSNNNDGRIKKIILSKNAENLFLEQMHIIDEMENILTKDIKSKDLKIFVKVLNTMRDNLKNYSEK